MLYLLLYFTRYFNSQSSGTFDWHRYSGGINRICNQTTAFIIIDWKSFYPISEENAIFSAAFFTSLVQFKIHSRCTIRREMVSFSFFNYPQFLYQLLENSIKYYYRRTRTTCFNYKLSLSFILFYSSVTFFFQSSEQRKYVVVLLSIICTLKFIFYEMFFKIKKIEQFCR